MKNAKLDFLIVHDNRDNLKKVTYEVKKELKQSLKTIKVHHCRIYDIDLVNEQTCDKVLFILTEDTHSIKYQLNGWLKALGINATSDRYLVINEDTHELEDVEDIENVTLPDGNLIRVKDVNNQSEWSGTVLLFLSTRPRKTENVGFSLTVDAHQETLEAEQLASSLRANFNKSNITEHGFEKKIKLKVNITVLLDTTHTLTEELKNKLLKAKLCGEINYVIFLKGNQNSNLLSPYFNGQFCRNQSFRLLVTCFHDLQLLKIVDIVKPGKKSRRILKFSLKHNEGGEAYISSKRVVLSWIPTSDNNDTVNCVVRIEKKEKNRWCCLACIDTTGTGEYGYTIYRDEKPNFRLSIFTSETVQTQTLRKYFAIHIDRSELIFKDRLGWYFHGKLVCMSLAPWMWIYLLTPFAWWFMARYIRTGKYKTMLIVEYFASVAIVFGVIVAIVLSVDQWTNYLLLVPLVMFIVNIVSVGWSYFILKGTWGCCP